MRRRWFWIAPILVVVFVLSAWLIILLAQSACEFGVVPGMHKVTSAEGVPTRYYHDEERQVGIWIYEYAIFVLPDADYKVK